jgi:hypothetical protein
MRNLTATICLTIAVLLGSAGVSWSAEHRSEKINKNNVAAESVFTLYRNNHNDPSLRVHVATFDTRNSGEHNKLHCDKAVKYFRSDAKSRGSDERYWCEVGYVKK